MPASTPGISAEMIITLVQMMKRLSDPMLWLRDPRRPKTEGMDKDRSVRVHPPLKLRGAGSAPHDGS
jgi:hypothetical protein